MQCENCKKNFIPCQVDECKNEAYYEGWARNYDGMGFSSGMMSISQVCMDHKSVLIGGKEPESTLAQS